jgi:O-antigen/teichoic acid export membrane protein
VSAVEWGARQLRRPFVRQASILQLGGFATLGISFLLGIALKRMLGPGEYGGYVLVISTFTTVSLFKRLGQDYIATTSLAAAYATGDAVAARRSLTTFNAVNVWATVLIIPLGLLLAPWIAELLLHDGSLAEPLRLALLPPTWAMLLATVVLVLQCSRRLVALTIVENANNLLVTGAGVLFLLFSRGVSSVLWGQAIASLGMALAALSIYRTLQRRDPLLPAPKLLVVDALRGRAARRELGAGLAVALDKNLVSLYQLLPVLLLGFFAPKDQAGQYGTAMSYVAIPLLALSAVSRLLMVKLPELHATQPERVHRFFLQVTAVGGGLSILVTLPFVLLAPWAIDRLFGADFAPSASLVPILGLDPLLSGFGIAAGPVYRTYHRNLWAVWTNLGVLLVGLPIGVLLVARLPLEGAALTYVGLVTTVRIIAYLLCLRIVRRG